MSRGFLFILMLISLSASSQTIQLKDDRSKIVFTVKNFGLKVSGVVSGLSGTFVLREDSLEKCHFDATVKAETINTGLGLRDKHLRAEDYFDVENFPFIRITSSSISKRHNQWVSEARVTIKNVTKTVSIPFTVVQNESGAIVRSNFTLNRLQYDVGGKSFSLDDSVHVQLEIFGEYDNPGK